MQADASVELVSGDAPRLQRIINPDQSVDHVIVHAGQRQAAQGLAQTQNPAMDKVYDLSVGTYDVSVTVGPSYQSKRQESVASIMALVSAYPEIMQFAGDILIRNMDWPGAKEIADRAQKMLPPQVQDQDDMAPEAQLARAQQQLQQMSKQHELLVKALNDATDVIKTKQVEQQASIKIADLNNATKIAVAEITTKAQEAKLRAEITMELWKELHGTAHEAGLAKMQQAHEQDLQAQGADQQAELAKQQAAQPEQGASNG